MHYSQRREAMGNTRSANGPTNVEVVFLFYDRNPFHPESSKNSYRSCS